jgi:gamma-tubulin complex component 2
LTPVLALLQDYDVLTTRLESLYLTSPDFTLQTAFLHLHPTLHVLSLLYSLCQSLEYHHKEESDGDDDSDDDEEEDMAKYLRAAGKEDGVDASKKGIIGGEVLGIVVERASCLNGFVPTSLLYGRCLDSDISHSQRSDSCESLQRVAIARVATLRSHASHLDIDWEPS